MTEDDFVSMREQRGGWLLRYRSLAFGWAESLGGAPTGFVPGVVAEDAHGNAFVAVGGNNMSGASEWRRTAPLS